MECHPLGIFIFCTEKKEREFRFPNFGGLQKGKTKICDEKVVS